jgi:glycosyltransferase involved in cell wall biosynthesis
MVREPVITPAIRRLAEEDPGHPWFRTGNVPVILAVGRLSPEKDFETLIRAFAEVRRNEPVRLIILGAEINAEYGARLRQLAAELGVTESLDLAGYCRNPYAFMARAKVFALSSLHEGCPNVLAEALYCGAHIVATDCPGGVREVLQDGALGTLVAVRDVSALAKALQKAIDMPSRPHRYECPEGFDSASSVTRYLALLSGTPAAGEGPAAMPRAEGSDHDVKATA